MRKIFGMFIILLSLLLFKNNIYAYEEYKVGDLLEYNNELWFVIEDSDKDKNYVTLLKKEPLTAEEVNKYNGGEYVSQNGEMIYAPDCDSLEFVTGSCNFWNYDDSYIPYLLNNWSNAFKDDLIDVDGYKVRIMLVDDLVNNLGFENTECGDYDYCSPKENGFRLKSTDNMPEWFKILNDQWAIKLNGENIFYNVSGKNINPLDRYSSKYSATYINPVINLDKDANICKKKYTINKELKRRNIEIDQIGYGISGSDDYFDEYTIIENSGENKDYVLAMRRYTLTAEDISKYSNGEYSDKNVPFYRSDTCNENDTSGCTTDYNKSIVKQIVDNYVETKLKGKTKEVNGITSRIINEDDLFERFGYQREWWTSGYINIAEYTGFGNHYYYVDYSNSVKWFMQNGKWNYNYEQWTMIPVDDSNNSIMYIDDMGNVYTGGGDYNQPNVYKSIAGIRPVVYFDKCAIGLCYDYYSLNVEDECVYGNGQVSESGLVCKEGINYKTEKIIHYKRYKVGDEVEYNGEKYHVIERSGTGKNYLTLLKDKPLTVEELYKYGKDENDKLFVNEYLLGEHDPEEVIYEFQDGSGGMAFYTSKECSAINNHGSVYINDSINITTGCNNDYNASDIKKVIDNWVKDNFNDSDLVENDGYKTRLLTLDDLQEKFNYEYGGPTPSSVSFKATEQTPDWLNNNENEYWTMTPYEDSNYEVFAGSYFIVSCGLDLYAVRPVVNIDKCAIEGGCEIEEVTIEDGCIEDTLVENTTVNKNKDIMAIIVAVGNTLNNIHLSILIICSLLIIGGLTFLISSYIKSKKELIKVRKEYQKKTF